MNKSHNSFRSPLRVLDKTKWDVETMVAKTVHYFKLKRGLLEGKLFRQYFF